MSSRKLGDEISHWLAGFRSEGVLTKLVTIHLAPPHLKNCLREKLHLCESYFQNAWKVMLDTDEQEAKVRARNMNYHNASRPNRTDQAEHNSSGESTTTKSFAETIRNSVQILTPV